MSGAANLAALLGAQPLWWLALPALMLPIWWHRQKRKRVKADMLATARFLPDAPPQQSRIWRWDDVTLLVTRCLLLLALIAWLAAVALPWRGDTVLVAPGAPQAWVEQQAAQAGMAHAPRVALPVATPALSWLQAREHEWRPQAKLLLLAASVPLPAQMPQLAHALDIRLAPSMANLAVSAASASASASASGSVSTPAAPLHIVLVAPAERVAAWRKLFAAFDVAGKGNVQHVVTESDGKGAQPPAALIVWDRTAPPPPAWHAPLWWLPAAGLPLMPAAAAPYKLTLDGIALQVVGSSRGRVWASDDWPPRDAGSAAALYEAWQTLHAAPEAYPLPVQAAPWQAQRSAPLAMPDTRPDAWLAAALLALFILERLLTHWLSHARRH